MEESKQTVKSVKNLLNKLREDIKRNDRDRSWERYQSLAIIRTWLNSAGSWYFQRLIRKSVHNYGEVQSKPLWYYLRIQWKKRKNARRTYYQNILADLHFTGIYSFKRNYSSRSQATKHFVKNYHRQRSFPNNLPWFSWKA